MNLPKNPFDEAKIVPPIIAGSDFATITEHMSFLKHGGPIEGKLSILNDILEGDKISNSLVKLGQVKIDIYQRPQLQKLGVDYEPDKATITYTPDIIMFSASHPLDNKTLSLLINSGHFERFKVCQVKITSEMARKYLKTDFKLDIEAHQRLKVQNEQLCKVKIKSIETPPEALLEPVYERIFEEIEIPDLRIKGDLLRTAAAHMVLRHFAQDNLKEEYTQNDYTSQDIDFVLSKIYEFTDPRVSPLIADEYIKVGKPRKRDEAKTLICDFLLASKQQGKPGEQLAALSSFVNSKTPGVHYQTVVNSVNELIKEGTVERVTGMHGYYRLLQKGAN